MNSKNESPSEGAKPSSRVNVALIILFVVAMTIVTALTKQQPCGCGGAGGSCPSPASQIEQTHKPSYDPNRYPVSDDTSIQQSSETQKKE